MCLGTMPTWLAKLKKYGPAGLANVSVTLLPLAVTLCRPAPLHSEYRSVAGVCFIRLNVKTTSSAVIGWPSLHFTPSRMVKSMDFLSAPHWYAEASIGVSAWFFRMLTKTSGS